MEIAVLGGTGTAGGAAVAELEGRGHRVRVLSRGCGFDVTDPSTFGSALDGVEAILDCLQPSKTTAKAARAVLVDGLAGVLAAGAAAGAGHVVSLSIVGIDEIAMSYYRVKLEQEAVVRAAPLPGTVLRATQFPQLFDGLWRATSRTGVLPVARGVVAPIDPRDVAIALADAVEAGPAAGEAIGIRGPETLEMRELAASWKAATGSRRPIVRLPRVGGALRAVAGGTLVDLSLPVATRTWDDWLRERAAAQATPQAAAR